MNYYFKKFLLFNAGGALLLLNSCNDPNTVGLEVLPANDQLNVEFCDTVTLISYTVREDSLTATNTSGNLAGTLSDPIFGYSKAGFFTQLAPLKNAPDFGVEPQADSVLLTLAYSGIYGDTTVEATDQELNVYLLSQDLHRDSTYYSTTKIGYSKRIGSCKFKPDMRDTVLRIKLDTAFFRTYILNQSGQSTLASVSSFQAYFKGIYVTPDPLVKPIQPGNRIAYFNLASTLTRLKLYYHNSVDTSQYDLVIDTKNSCVAVNHFDHNYVGTPVEQQLKNKDTVFGEPKVYLQSMAGVKTKLMIPHLKNFLSIGRIAINKAELIISTDPGSQMGFHPASQLAVQGIDSNGVGTFTGDYFESLSFRGGEYDATTGQYKTNITRFVQQVLTDKTKNNGLYLVVYGGSVFANRSVLLGSGPFTSGKIKLQITYSLLN